jgi:hypothetical protein
MTLDELKAAYPGCPDAVEWFDHGLDSLWAKARSLGWTVDQFKERCQGVQSIIDREGGLRAGAKETAAMAQLDTEDFRRYFAAKMGML